MFGTIKILYSNYIQLPVKKDLENLTNFANETNLPLTVKIADCFKRVMDKQKRSSSTDSEQAIFDRLKQATFNQIETWTTNQKCRSAFYNLCAGRGFISTPYRMLRALPTSAIIEKLHSESDNDLTIKKPILSDEKELVAVRIEAKEKIEARTQFISLLEKKGE